MKISKSKVKWSLFILTTVTLYCISRVGEIAGETLERNAAVASLNGGNLEYTWQRLLSENQLGIQVVCAATVIALFFLLLIHQNEK